MAVPTVQGNVQSGVSKVVGIRVCFEARYPFRVGREKAKKKPSPAPYNPKIAGILIEGSDRRVMIQRLWRVGGPEQSALVWMSKALRHLA